MNNNCEIQNQPEWKDRREKYDMMNGKISKSYKLSKDLTNRFADACSANGTNQSEVLTNLMENYITQEDEK